MQDRIKPLTGVRNFRDFGGYAGLDGRKIRPGLLYRSGHYANVTDEDIDTLAGYGIALQVDLRRPDERERDVAKWPFKDVHVVTVDEGRETEAPHQKFLKKVEADPDTAKGWMDDYYKTAPFKPHHVALYTSWFDKLAGLNGDQAALINCAAGKDRTGIACALTHHILGVSKEDIYSDYLLTNAAVNVDSVLDDAKHHFNNMLEKNYDREVYRPFLGVDAQFLETAHASIQETAGTIDTYLEETLNVTEDKKEAIRARLLDPA